jgi:hypothetical protein
MKKIIEEILKLPYIDNKNYKHENTIKNIFIQNCLEEYKLQKKLNKKTFKEEVDRKLKNGQFIHQPLGSQNHPDFILKWNNKLYCFECKSCQVERPIYNGGIPHKNSIYIFCSKKYNKTTIYYGDEIGTEQQRELISSLEKEIKNLVKKYQQLPEWKNDPRGLDYYPRNMYIQSGGNSKIDYFTHKDREKCERRILDEFANIPNIE